MPLTLELPPSLGEELEEEAGKIGVSTQEHAALLLCLWVALVSDEHSTPFKHAVRLFFSRYELDADQVGAVCARLVRWCLELPSDLQSAPAAESPDVTALLYGSLQAWRDWYAHRPVAVVDEHGPHDSASTVAARGSTPALVRPSAKGKYSHVRGSSDDFANVKQAEIEREERKRI